MKVGRNDPCPCGSGKKFKKCCYRKIHETGLPEGVGILAEEWDLNKKTRVVMTDNLLENQILKQGPKIAESFDKCYGKDFKEISAEMSRCAAPLFLGFREIVKKPWQLSCFQILFNAFNTVSCALIVLRQGYRLQPGILLRNVFEAISVVLAIIQDEKTFKLYSSGRLDSAKTLSIAKKILPFLGELYGRFSEDFAHISSFHGRFNRLNEFQRGEEAAEFNLSAIRMTSILLYITTELLCYDYVPKLRYWERIAPGQYKYNPSGTERDWQKKYLLVDRELS